MNQVYLILGSNIEPEKNIPLALDLIRRHPLLQVKSTSSIWQTKAIGTLSIDFYNLGVKIVTSLSAHSLKEDVLCVLESRMKRVRVEDKNAPRTIDIDIVIFNNEVIDKNAFRLDYLVLPLSEIIPDLISPDGRRLTDIAAERMNTTLARKITDSQS